MFDIKKIRNDFPIFKISVNSKPNTFLDTAASAQKPQCVIDKMIKVYSQEYANVHRGSYLLSEEITSAYENARDIVKNFINAEKKEDIVAFQYLDKN